MGTQAPPFHLPSILVVGPLGSKLYSILFKSLDDDNETTERIFSVCYSFPLAPGVSPLLGIGPTSAPSAAVAAAFIVAKKTV